MMMMMIRNADMEDISIDKFKCEMHRAFERSSAHLNDYTHTHTHTQNRLNLKRSVCVCVSQK